MSSPSVSRKSADARKSSIQFSTFRPGTREKLWMFAVAIDKSLELDSCPPF